MSETNENMAIGILKGLKRVLFQQEPVVEVQPPAVNQARPVDVAVPSSAMRHSEETFSDPVIKDMKLKVYQLLENLNKPGVDFFEVWNAAVEMGGSNSNNIKAAFTSLKFADKSLTKTKLLESGAGYITALKSVLETESKKRQDEKIRLDKEMQQVRANLGNEITAIEQQLSSLQAKLAIKKTELENVQAKYEPGIAEIDVKIKSGQQSVNSVLQEMQQVMDLINTDIN